MATRTTGKGPRVQAEAGPTEATPVYKRNPEAPIVYAPLVDVRTSPTGQDLHLVCFVPPAVSPADIYDHGDGQGPRILVESVGEVIVPLESVEGLIVALADRYRDSITTLITEDATAEGVDVGEIELPAVDDVLSNLDTEED